MPLCVEPTTGAASAVSLVEVECSTPGAYALVDAATMGPSPFYIPLESAPGVLLATGWVLLVAWTAKQARRALD